jgi:dsRNA-specific ribonuclease
MKSKPDTILLDYLAEVSVRLAHIGDQVFGLVVTDLIQDLYPYLRVGHASVRHCQSPWTLSLIVTI